MVDFQSRDTRRGPTEGDDSDEADEDEAESATTDSAPAADTSAEEPPADSGPATDQTDAERPASATAPTADGETGVAQTGETDTADATGSDGRAEQANDPLAASPTTQTRQVAVAVVTVGTATEAGDPTGEAVTAALTGTGQTVVATERLRGDYDGVQQAVDRLVGRDDVEAVVTAGGVGVGPTEHALEAVHPLFEKALPGFEEVYRSLLFEQRGTGVVRIRATAGIADGTPVFCLPADPAAARVAVEEIISVEVGPLVEELAGDADGAV